MDRKSYFRIAVFSFKDLNAGRRCGVPVLAEKSPELCPRIYSALTTKFSDLHRDAYADRND